MKRPKNNQMFFPSKVEQLIDVDTSTLVDGDALVWDAGTQTWVNQAVGGATTLETLTDVNIASVQDGETIVWDSDTNKWINVSIGNSAALTAFSTNLDLTGNSTLTDVPGLSINVEANTNYTYAVQLLVVDSTPGQQNLRMKCVFPSSAQGLFQVNVQEYTDPSIAFAPAQISGKGSYPNHNFTLNGAVSGELFLVNISGHITTDVDAGVAKIQCAQVVASASPLLIQAPSWMTMIKNV